MKIGHYEFHRPAARSLRAQATRLRSLARFIMWSIIVAFSLLFVLGITTAVVVQTDWFHRWAAEKLTAVLSDELEAKLEFRSIRFNLFKGIELDSVHLSTRGDTVLSASSLRLRYELEPLLIRHIVISEVQLLDANIRLLRSKQDSTWNVDHIVKPSPDDPNKKPLDWGITVRNVALLNARVRVCDSLSFEPIENRLHYTRLDLDSVNLRMSATLNLAAKQYAVSIDDLQCIEHRCALHIEHLRCAAEIDSSHIALRNLRFMTPGSNFHLHGSIDSTNVFDSTTDLATRPLNLHIEPSKLMAHDINLFLPPDFSLGADFELHSTVSGNLNVMHFDVDRVQTQNTELHGSYTMHNVANARPFIYEVELQHSSANFSDIRRALPTLKMGEIAFLDHLRLDQTRVYGTKDSIAAIVGVQGDFGQVQGTVGLLTREKLVYNAELDVQSFDTYPFTQKYSQASRLNGHLSLDGSGTTLDDLQAQLGLHLNHSSFGGKDISSLQLNASMLAKVLTVDTLDVRFPLSAADSTVGYSAADQRELRLKGALDLNDVTMPAYSVQARTQLMPLAQLVGDNNLPQSFSADIKCNGVGFHPDSLQVDLQTDVTDFILTDGALFPFKLSAKLSRSDAQHRHLELHSDFADANVDGRYRLGTAWSVFLVHIGMLDKYVRNHYAKAQSDSASFKPMLPYSLPDDTLDLKYNLKVRGMAAIAPFIKGVRLDARGNISGSISGTPSCYQFVVDTARVRRFSMRIDQDFVYSQPITMSLHMQTENMTSQPFIEQAILNIRCDSVLRINTTRFVVPRFNITILDDHARFMLSTRMENHIPLYARGSMHNEGNIYRVNLDSLYAGWSRSLAFRTTHPAHLLMSPQGVRVDSLSLQYIGGEDRISLSGLFNSNSFDHMKVDLRQFDVETLKKIPELVSVNALQMLGGVVDSLSVDIHGKYSAPRFEVQGRMMDMRYNDVPIGVQSLQGSYDGKNIRATSTVIAHMGDSVKTLDLNVNAMPLSIALSPMKMSMRDNEHVDITIAAAKLSLAAVSPFVPGISNLDGKADAQMRISGTTPDKIDYSGNVTFDNASFVVPATKIWYTAGGRLSLKNTTVNLDSIRIKNVESDLPGGAADVTGLMRIRGFTIRDLDIYAQVSKRDKFLVMSEATAGASDFMYGRTTISTQDNDRGRTQRRLHFHGTPDRPLLEGFVMIEDADIKFPPTIDRTTRTSTMQYVRTGNNYRLTEVITKAPSTDTTIGDLPPEEPIMKRNEQKLEKSFVDILYTSVDCKIENFMTVQMDFGLNDQMVAIVRQENPRDAMRFIRDGSRSTSLKSDLIIDPATTYKFYSNFIAEGTMNIDGPIDNPRLNIKASMTSDRVVNDRKSTYKVELTITGTKKKPIVTMNYYIDGRLNEGAVTDDERTTNALLLTMFGFTQSELGGSSNLGNDVGNKLASSPVGVIFNKVLQGSVIKNVNIDLNGGVADLSQAHVKVTAAIFPGTALTLGGTLSDPTVTFTYPITANTSASLMRATTPGASATRQQKNWELKYGVHIP